MGLEALFDEPKIKVEKTDYEKGKKFCCNSVCSQIKEDIKQLTEQIDDVLVEYPPDIYPQKSQSLINDDRIAIKTLQILRRKITEHEPYCRCR